MDGAAATLSDQIMDELMDRPMTATELSRALGAKWMAVVLELFHLQRQGLVHPLNAGNGQQELPFAMTRTRKAAA